MLGCLSNCQTKKTLHKVPMPEERLVLGQVVSTENFPLMSNKNTGPKKKHRASGTSLGGLRFKVVSNMFPSFFGTTSHCIRKFPWSMGSSEKSLLVG